MFSLTRIFALDFKQEPNIFTLFVPKRNLFSTKFRKTAELYLHWTINSLKVASLFIQLADAIVYNLVPRSLYFPSRKKRELATRLFDGSIWQFCLIDSGNVWQKISGRSILTTVFTTGKNQFPSKNMPVLSEFFGKISILQHWILSQPFVYISLNVCDTSLT